MIATDVIKSVRSWLHAIYPDASILVQRNVQGIQKPFFMIEDVSETFVDRGHGYHDVTTLLRVHLMLEDPPSPDGRQDTYWRIKASLSALAEDLRQRRVIPAYRYGLQYPQPVLWLHEGGTAPWGTHRIAVSAVTADGRETLPSREQVLEVPTATTAIRGAIANWPRQLPLAARYRVYVRETTADPQLCVQEVNCALGFSVTQFTLNDLTPLAPQVTAPATSRVPAGMMKVNDVTAVVYESTQSDDAFYGWLQLRLTSHSPHMVEPTAVIESLTATELGPDFSVTQTIEAS